MPPGLVVSRVSQLLARHCSFQHNMYTIFFCLIEEYPRLVCFLLDNTSTHCFMPVSAKVFKRSEIFFVFFPGSDSQVFLFIGQRLIASFEGSN